MLCILFVKNELYHVGHYNFLHTLNVYLIDKPDLVGSGKDMYMYIKTVLRSLELLQKLYQFEILSNGRGLRLECRFAAIWVTRQHFMRDAGMFETNSRKSKET